MIQFILVLLTSSAAPWAGPLQPTESTAGCASLLHVTVKNSLTASAFALTLLNAPESQAGPADPAPCTLLTENVGREDRAAWEKLGYTLREVPNLGARPSADKARLMDDSHLVLLRRPGGDVMQLSTTNGQYPRGWSPLSFDAPARGSAADARYACFSITARLPFYRESRAAAVEVLRLAEGKSIQRTRGEAVLDLERSALVQRGMERFENGKARAAYRRLLERVNTLPEGDVFTRWWQARRLIYGSKNARLGTCATNSIMTTALTNERCTDAQGETYLLTSLFLDAGFTPPAGWRLGVQRFVNHVRPVLYDADKGLTFDLATGARGPARGAIADVEALYRQLWLGHDRLRFEGEVARVNRVPITYAHRDWSCVFGFAPSPATNVLRAADLGALTACATFNPTRDQDDKARRASFDEDADAQIASEDAARPPAPVESTRPSRKSAGTSDRNAIGEGGGGGSGSGLVQGLSNWLSEMFGGTPEQILDQDRKEAMRTLAENLIPRERAVMEAFAEDPVKAIDAFHRIFSAGGVLTDLGFAHLVGERAPGDLLFPLHVAYDANPSRGRTGRGGAAGLLYDVGGPRDTEVGPCPWGFSSCLRSSDRALVDELRAQPSADRFATVARRVFARRLARAVDRLRSVRPLRADVRDSLDAVVNGGGGDVLRELVRGLGDVGDGLQAITGNAQSEAKSLLKLTLYGLIFEDVDVRGAAATPLGLAKQLEDQPITALQWMGEDASRTRAVFGNNELMATLDEAIRHFLSLPATAARYARWEHAGTTRQAVENVFLLSVLKHPQYFVTVEPDADEVLSVRPYYPLRLTDERVRELKSERRDPPVAEIDLPTIAGLTCPPGGRGWFRSGSFAVECRRGSETAPDADGSDHRSQTGVLEGTPTGRERGLVRGDDERTQAGLIRRPTEGKDTRGDLPLPFALSDKRDAYPRAEESREVRDGTVQRLESSPEVLGLDPRPELELSPELWRRILGSVEPATFDQPVIKVLMHHAYRRKLKAVYADLPRAVPLRLIDFTDLTEPDLTRAAEDRARGKVGETDVKVADEYEGLGQELFLRAALAELKSPKSGHVVTSRDLNPTRVDEARMLEEILTGAGPGRVLPARQPSGTPLFFDQFSRRRGSIYLDSSPQYLPAVLRYLFETRRQRSVRYAKGTGDPVGVEEVRGGVYGPERLVYYRLAAPGFATRDQRRTLAKDELR